jgi:16S rRNA processing protein RimM
MPSDWLSFGILGRPHGTRGEIRLHLHAAGGQALAGHGLPSRVRLVAKGESREVGLESARPMQEGFLVRFDGIADRESAGALVGQEVQIPRQVLASLGAAEFYVQDIVGFEAVDGEGRLLGQIRGTIWNGAQDVMVIVDQEGGERLLPVVPEYVLAFDGERRRLVVDPHD